MSVPQYSLASTPENTVPTDTQNTLRQYYFDAARNGNIPMLNEFIQAGFDLNTQDAKGHTALTLAAYHGHKAMVERLLNAGADPCSQDHSGNTALMGAIFKGELKIARLLMKTACSPNQQNVSGQTASMYAALFQRKEILDDLIKNGANTQIKDHRGNSVDNLSHGEFK
ncbi:ankyrin repeat domain-containing protein [Acinetobacter baretiae]|nr:ankyrin repeat domain-containing protein [Acinetobacter baretiae]